MKYRLLIAIIAVFAFGKTLHAQISSLQIQGKITDTLHASLPSATVLLLDPVDTSLISYARTNNDGEFVFKNLKKAKYIVKSTYLGFIPSMILVDVQDGKSKDMGVVKLKEIASELMEVVIKAAKAPISIRGDTIEYDASTFKVPEGSTVEDLLRRLPGLDVASDGSIKSEGRDVTKVTVDGKRFFGSDPKAATKNLPAEGISKVQIFNEETEEQKLTGSSSTPPDKTMNLKLKDDFKKGGFGKATAGIGTEDTYEFKGNYNKFNDKEQFSILGNTNNTGRNGLSWNDYQDFKGAGGMRWGDGGDFGFGSGGRRFIMYSDDDDSDGAEDVSSSFFGGGSAGLPKNYSGGVNYNYNDKKNDFSGVYFYSQKGLLSETTNTGQTFLSDATLNKNNLNTADKTSKNHAMEFRFEKTIDSLNSLVLNVNTALNNSHNLSGGILSLNRNNSGTNVLSNYSVLDNLTDKTTKLARINAIYRKKFKTKGRSLGLSSSFVINKADSDAHQSSDNKFYDLNGILDSTSLINQNSNTVADKNQVDANAMYTEPLSKKVFWSTFYNFSNSNEKVDRGVFDNLNNVLTPNDLLSRNYNNAIMTNRLGSFVRYNYNGTNISLGIARQRYDLKGDYNAGPTAGISGTIDKTYYNWLPNVGMNFDLKGNKYLSLEYDVSASLPSIRQLQPIIDNSNPLYITVGNPDLIPEVNHEISGRYSRFSPFSFINFSANVGYSLYEDQIISNQTVNDKLVTTTNYINYSGGQSMWSWCNFSFPIIKNKFTVNFNFSPNYSKSFAFVNTALNKTNTLSNRGGFGINFTPNDKLSVYANGSVTVSDTKYDINSSQNQSTVNQNYSLEVNTKLIWNIFLNSSFNYSKYQNDRFAFNREVPILNISLYRLVLPKNRAEVRISLYDAFNKNTSISQNSSFNSFSQTSTPTLARYAMLSLSYNIRGMKSSVKKDTWW